MADEKVQTLGPQADGKASVGALEKAAPEGPKAEGAEPDWKKLFEEGHEVITKVRHEADTLRGLLRKQQDIEEVLREIKDRHEASDRILTAMVRAQATGSTTGLEEEVKAAREGQVKAASQSHFVREARALHTALQEAATDEEGKPIVELDKAAELEEARRQWAEALEAQDLAGLHKATRTALVELRKLERRALKVQLEEAKKAAKEEKKKALAEAGVLELEEGKSAAGGQSLEALMAVDVSKMPFGKLEQHKQALDQARKRARGF